MIEALRAKNLLQRTSKFLVSFFSELKPNEEKFEVAGISVKKGVKMTLCRMNNKY